MRRRVRGYKVFNSDWTCQGKQYACPGKFEEKGKLEICGHGMHFCQTVADCFNYYSFDSSNKVAEVIAYGKVRAEGDKLCTNKLEIVREVPWSEVLQIVNTGKDCTGFNNTGDNNFGHCNTGDVNSGSFNAGNHNTGYVNTGSWNTGNRNTGDRNLENYNTGSYNAGNGNAGCNNTGNCNTGRSNAGNFNTGHRNTGHRNTGNWNIGNRNTGDWNKCSFSTGCFNTKESKIMLFNKPSNMTFHEWHESDARRLLNHIPKNVTEWVDKKDMTDKEKAEYPTYKTTGGFLKVLDESECAQSWWNDLSEDDRNIILAIPNFDPDIFEECTGIRVQA